MPRYHRLGHMLDTPRVKVGDWVRRGQLIGLVGSTGNSSGPHLHYDIMECAPPASFIQYVYGWTLARVRALYPDPAPYCKMGIPMYNSLPMNGYSYLQWTGECFHPGIDLNGVNDLGAPIYSPVEGRVVFVLGTTWYKNLLGKLLSKNYNAGWGNMVVIEQSPDFKL